MKDNRLIIQIKTDPESFFLFLCTLVWTRDVIILYISSVLYKISGIELLSNIVVYSLFIIATFGALPYIQKQIKIKDVVLYSVLLLIYIISIYTTSFDLSKTYLKDFGLKFATIYLPLIFVGIGIHNEHIEWLHKVSILSIFLNMVALLVFNSSTLNLTNDNMGLSYYILTHVNLVAGFYFQKKKPIDLIALILGTIILLVYGTRGPLLCYILFIGIYLLFFKKFKHGFLAKIGIVISCFLAYALFVNFIPLLSTIVQRWGLSTRIFDSIQTGTFLADNGRNDISRVVMEHITEQPLKGYGLAADRTFTDRWGTNITYAHNIVLELWLAFGIIIGTIILLLILRKIFKGLKYTNVMDMKILILSMTVGVALVRLLFSGSFLETKFFFLLLGVCIGSERRGRIEADNYREIISYGINGS